MIITRSSKTHFSHLTKTKRSRLKAVLAEYARVCNYFIITYKDQIPTTPKKIYWKAEYIQAVIKNTNTWLSARMVKCAVGEAYGMVQSYQSNLIKNPKHRLPKHNGRKAILSSNIATHGEADNMADYDYYCKIGCIGDRKGRANSFIIPLKKHKHFNKLNGLGKISSSITITAKYIQFSWDINAGSKPATTIGSTIIGVDTGINVLATTSSGHFYGLDLKYLIEDINRKQSGSKNQRTAIRRLHQYIDETVKALIKAETPQLIILEHLKNITKNTKRRLGKASRLLVRAWNVSYWLDRIKQACDANRVRYAVVSPRNTSIMCSQCDHTHKSQRLGLEFNCMLCGYNDHADHNAAINIYNRWLRGAYGPSGQKVKTNIAVAGPPNPAIISP